MKLYVGITDYDWFRYLKAASSAAGFVQESTIVPPFLSRGSRSRWCTGRISSSLLRLVRQ